MYILLLFQFSSISLGENFLNFDIHEICLEESSEGQKIGVTKVVLLLLANLCFLAPLKKLEKLKLRLIDVSMYQTSFSRLSSFMLMSKL